jgi:hypothetical protein
MQMMTISEAAAVLNVSSTTIRSWEQRFGYPIPQRSPGGHRRFVYGEIVALREGLAEGLSISSAVSRARDGLASDSRGLVAALRGYDSTRADQAIEAALALRSLERTVEEVITPALERIAAEDSIESAAWAFAAQWASDWFSRARRLFAPPFRPFSIVIADASRDALDAQSPSIRAVELLLARGGANVMSVAATCTVGVGELVAAREADVILVAGAHVDDDHVARWVYAARRSSRPELSVALYRRPRRAANGRAAGIDALPDEPVRAARAILQHLHARDPFEQRSPARYSLTVLHEKDGLPSSEAALADDRPARRRAATSARGRALVA